MGKSTVSAILALWKASVFPNSTVLITAPSQRQALLLFQVIVDFYKKQSIENKVPGDEVLKLRLELKNGSKIFALHGQERTLRGFTADLIIADEAARLPDDGALIQALSPALSTRGGTMMLISTPAGDVGYFRDCFYSPEWSSHRATVEECPRISEGFLASERATMPSRIYEQEYECAFIAAPGAVFTTEEIDAAFTKEVLPVTVPSKVLPPQFLDPLQEQRRYDP